MRKSLRKIFKHSDGTEHDTEEYEGQEHSRYSSDNSRRSESQSRHAVGFGSPRQSMDFVGHHRPDTQEARAALSGGPAVPPKDDVDDATVKRVLLNTRGQDGPVVRGMGEPEPSTPTKSFGHSAASPAQFSGTDPRASQDGLHKSPIPPLRSERRSVDYGNTPVDDRYARSGNSAISPVVGLGGVRDQSQTRARDSSRARDGRLGGVRDQSQTRQTRESSRGPPVTGLREQSQTRRRSIDQSRAAYSPTAAFFGKDSPEASSIRKINDDRIPIATSALLDNYTPPGTSTTRKPVDTSRTSIDHGSSLTSGTVLNTGNSLNSGTSGSALNTSMNTSTGRMQEKAVDSSVAQTNFNAPQGLTRRKVGDEDFTNTVAPTTEAKPNGTSAGWPLVNNAADPADVTLSRGQQINVADGVIAAAFAAKYTEPDKYSSTMHMHKEETKIANAVVHEKIKPIIHEIITTKIERHIHTHEIRQHIQPIIHREVLPDRHWVKQEDGSVIEISAEVAETLKSHAGYREEDRFQECIGDNGKSDLDPSKLAGAKTLGGY